MERSRAALVAEVVAVVAIVLAAAAVSISGQRSEPVAWDHLATLDSDSAEAAIALEQGDEAFHGCKNLTEFDAADGLQYIGRAAFSACPDLTSIDLEMGPAYIDDRAFDGSGAVKSLIPGSMLQYVGEDAFAELTFMEGELIVDPTAKNLNDTIWSGKGDGILRHTRRASHDNGFIGTEG